MVFASSCRSMRAMDSWIRQRRSATAHSSCCSRSTAPTVRVTEVSTGLGDELGEFAGGDEVLLEDITQV